MAREGDVHEVGTERLGDGTPVEDIAPKPTSLAWAMPSSSVAKVRPSKKVGDVHGVDPTRNVSANA